MSKYTSIKQVSYSFKMVKVPSSPFYLSEEELTPVEEIFSPENSDHELDLPQISPTPESYQGGESPDSTLFQTISPYQSDGEGVAYDTSTHVYVEDEVERFNISLELPGNSLLEENPEIEFLGYFRNGQFLGYSRNDQLRTESQTEDSNQSPQYSPASPNDSLNEYLMSDSEDNEDTVRARSSPPDIPFSKLWSKVLSMRQNRSRSKSRSRSRSPINRMSRHRRNND